MRPSRSVLRTASASESRVASACSRRSSFILEN
jgi:hypothetical protein